MEFMNCPYCSIQLDFVSGKNTELCPVCKKEILFDQAKQTVQFPEKALPEFVSEIDTAIIEAWKTVTEKDPGATIKSVVLNKTVSIDQPHFPSITLVHTLDETLSQVPGTGTARSEDFKIDAAGVESPVSGEFSILEKIGEGGMGVVYLAEQEALKRRVAIKMVKGEASLSHFTAEALVTGELEHPNIVPVYALGKDQNQSLFFAMKRVQGLPWQKLLHPELERDPEKYKVLKERAEKMALSGHLEIFQKSCDAVAFAHSREIIHRDLKPENIMVGAFGEVLVMDWGLAVDVRENPASPKKGVPRSEAVGIAGTLAYMAPEQAGGAQQLSPLTDVYLMGAILYEILTGSAPHRGTDKWKIIESILRGEIEVPEVRAPAKHIPGELSKIALKALAKDPKERYESIIALATAVTAFLSGEMRRDESRAVSGKVAEEFKRSGKSGKDKYEQYADFQSRLQRALSLWPENTQAVNLYYQATESYARFAIKNGDLLLARTQAALLKSSVGEVPSRHGGAQELYALKARALEKEVNKEEARRKARTRNFRIAVTSIAVLVLLVIAGLSYFLNEIKKETALARAAEQEAKTARLLAEQEKDEVKREHLETIQAHQETIKENATALKTQAVLKKLIEALREELKKEKAD